MSKNQIAIEAFKAVISEIDLKSSTKDLSEQEIENILKKESKKFIEASNAFKNKDDQKSFHYSKCAEILNAYLPKQIDSSKYVEIAKELKKDNPNFGSLMKAAKSKYGSSLNMKEFNKAAKELF